PRRRLGRDHPLGHQQLRQPAARRPAFAGAAARQRRREPTGAQPVFAGVYLRNTHRHAPDGRRDAQRTVTFTAGEYTSRPAQPTRISAHHWPGSTQTGGAASNSSSTVPRAGNSRPTAAGPIHSHVPHGLIRCASTARSACASVPTVTASRAVSPADTSTGSGGLTSRSNSASAAAATRTTHPASTTSTPA